MAAAPDLAPTEGEARAATLLALVGRIYREVHHHPPADAIRLDSTLDQELGFDSLARVELLLRIEKTFGLRMPDSVLESAETPADLLQSMALAGTAVAEATLPVVDIVRPEAEAGVPDTAQTLVAALQWHVHRHPARVQIDFLPEEGAAEQRITYAELWQQAREVAAGIQARGVAPRQTVGIMLPTGPDYFCSYFGVLLAGAIPVPIYPPFRLSQIEEHVRRQSVILGNAQAAMLVTVPKALGVAQLIEARVPSLRHRVTPAQLREQGDHHVGVAVKGDDIAFIQYTSGSTGQPKGVVLTHANLLANIRAIGAAVRIAPDDVFVSWLPLYHDMGLIAAWLASLYYGNPLVVMSPLTFLARPERWLWAIHRYRGTLTAAPNFAYELCVKRIEDERLQGLDLGSLRLAANGSEQVLPETIARFQQRFGRYGFHSEAMTPVYGLAESTVGLLVPPLGVGPRIDRVRRTSLVRESRALPASEAEISVSEFVCCGQPLPGHEVRVVGTTGLELPDRVEGRLEFRGPSATQGYFRNPELSRDLWHDGWLDTGDRAYRADGQIYVTGRVKDIIIRGGRNLYPHEIEEAVGALPGIRRGCVVAFGVADRESGTERLVVVAETRATAAAEQAALREAVMRAVRERLGEPPDEVVLAPPKTVLKTSSGKLRRSATREVYLAGRVGTSLHAVGWQLARLIATAVLPQLRRWLRRLREILYAAYVWLLFALMAPVAWLLVAGLPRPVWAWRALGRMARLFLALVGIRLHIEGLQRLPKDRICVLVANHASYVDGLALTAALPGPYCFIAKKELGRAWLSGVFLRRLGTEFVERFAIQESVQDAQRIVQTARAGNSLVFFPEGTFAASAGLLPFHLGAFVVAARAGTPVVPVAILGTRAILRGDERFPRHGAIDIRIGAPLVPGDGDVFAEALRLRDEARAWILAQCDEPEVERMAPSPRPPTRPE